MTPRPITKSDLCPVQSELAANGIGARRRNLSCVQRLFIGSLMVVLLNTGCRSRAHQDLYQAKLASQIRVLEDQLYDADYQNRILSDELKRARQSDLPSSPMAPVLSDSYSSPQQSTIVPPVVPIPMVSPGSIDPLALEQPILGDPFVDDPTAETLPRSLPAPPAASDMRGIEEPEGSQPLRDPVESDSKGTEAIPAPVPTLIPESDLIPPGKSELQSEQIDQGMLLPPKRTENPPSRKIEMPQDASILHYEPPKVRDAPVADHLELHKSLSGGHQFDADDEIDGLYLVVTVVDQYGKVLSLDQFDVDAEISIVVLDPTDESEDDRIGRWDFTPDEVRDFIRSTPVDGIHVPIAWQDRIPASDDVIVHVRMAAAEEEMRCQGQLKLEESVAMSNWLPRG